MMRWGAAVMGREVCCCCRFKSECRRCTAVREGEEERSRPKRDGVDGR